MFLTPKELEDLTGYTLPAKQLAWLRENGYIHEINGKGRPVVLKAYAVARMGGDTPKTEHEPQLVL